MDWDALRILLAVARTGRISGAARVLGVEHTTVGRRLAALEEDLGVPLFHRTARGYLLTPYGERALAQAENMERSALAIGAQAREASGVVAGRVRVALLDEFAAYWLAPSLPVFHARHPAIDLQVLVGVQQLDLARGEADLAVRWPRPRQVGLAAARLARTSTGLYASRKLIGRKGLRVVDGASLRGLPLCVYTPPHRVLQEAPWFQPVLAQAKIALSTDSTGTLLVAARASLGVSVLPRLAARSFPDLVAVSADVASHDMWLVTHPEVRRDPKVRATAEFLKSIASRLC